MKKYDIIIIGAGFAGIYGTYKFHQLGYSVICFESAPTVGGTWYWNAYPNARCDLEAMLYSFKFDDEIQQKWHWDNKYAYQPEILHYLEYVTEKHKLWDFMKFNCAVTAAKWDEVKKEWNIALSTGESFLATFVISATGYLSEPKYTKFEGLEKFKGTVLRASRWPKETQVEQFKGKRVAVIGTGGSGVQMTPALAREASLLYIVQRTPRYVAPVGQKPLTREEEMEVKKNYKSIRERHFNTLFGIQTPRARLSAKTETEEEFNRNMEELYKEGGMTLITGYLDILFDRDSNRRVGDFHRKKIRQIVKDPQVAEALCPSRDLMVFAHRVIMEDYYYETFNRENVKLLSRPYSRISFDESNLLINEDEKYPVDIVILATGWLAYLGSLVKINFQGKNGIKLSEKWAEITDNFLGLTIPQFPNLFLITGPGSPSQLSLTPQNIEQHIDYVADIIEFMKNKNLGQVEVPQAVADGWVRFTSSIMDKTVLKSVKNNFNTNLKGEIGYIFPFLGFDLYTKKLQETKENEFKEFEFK